MRKDRYLVGGGWGIVSRKFESYKVYKVGKWQRGWGMGDGEWVMEFQLSVVNTKLLLIS
ncbi:MAG TPA: hypothetical protein PLH30_05125 [Bacteroidales bacterium]|nr:hypothetical protein [Bacteroidales bacterium]